MEYTSLRSLAVTGYTLVYLPVYMALAAVIGLIVLPVGFWLSLRVRARMSLLHHHLTTPQLDL
jgi:Tfp pilus assembly protein FimT